MDITGREAPEPGNRTAWWLRQRRLLMLGPAATCAVSAWDSLRSGYGEATAGSPFPSRGRGQTGASSPGGARATIVREISFDRPARAATFMAWSADGERLAIGGSLDLRMSVFDVRTGRPLPAPGDQLAGVKGLAYSSDGRYLGVIRAGTGSTPDPAARYTVSLWDARTAAHVRNVVEPSAGEIASIAAHDLAFSSDGRYLAVAYLRQTAVYALSEGGDVERVALLPPASRCAFRPGEAVLASLSMGLGPRALTVTRIAAGQVVTRLDVQGANLGWSPDGRRLAITNGPSVQVYDVTSGRDPRVALVADGDVSFKSVSFSPDRRWLAAAAGRRVDIWDATTLAHGATLSRPNMVVTAAAFSPRGRLLAVAGDAPIVIWDVQ